MEINTSDIITFTQILFYLMRYQKSFDLDLLKEKKSFLLILEESLDLKISIEITTNISKESLHGTIT